MRTVPSRDASSSDRAATAPLPRTCFSIEPGIYLPEFGVRSEVNVYVGDDTITVTGGPEQRALVPLLKQ